MEVRLKPDADEPGKPLARGLGSSKKLAEQDAARRALKKLATPEAGARKAAEPDADEEEHAAQ